MYGVLLGAGITETMQAQLPPFRVENLKVDGEPMPGNNFDMLEDDRGFIWLASANGLSKYDGTSLTLFSHRPDKPGSIVPGNISKLIPSRHHRGFWLGSNEMGVSFWDIQLEKAINFIPKPGLEGSLANGEIGGLCEDAEGGLWVGTGKFTLHYLPPSDILSETQSFQSIRPPIPSNAPAKFAEDELLGGIIEDRFDKKAFWIGCRYGIYHFDQTTEAFTFYPFDSPLKYWSAPKGISLFQDEKGRIWCGGYVSGLKRLDPASGLWKQFSKTIATSDDGSDNSIFTLKTLDNRYLLAGSGTGQIWSVDLQTDSIHYLQVSHEGLNQHDVLYFLHRTQNGMLWAGLRTKMVRLIPQEGYWPYLSFRKIDERRMRNNWQRSFAISPDKQWLYMGTLKGDGLLRLHLRDDRLESFATRPNIADEETDIMMDALCFDPGNRLWIGSENGLWIWEEGYTLLKRYVFQPNGEAVDFPKIRITAICLDGNLLWIGTKGKGLYFLNRQTHRWGQVSGVAGLQNNSILNTLLKDSKGRIWAAFDGGLAAFEVSEKNGLPIVLKSWYFREAKGQLSGTATFDLQIDALGHLWVSTLGGGVDRLRNADPENPLFDYYFNNDQPGGNMLYGIAVQNPGRIWMGSQYGICVLDTATRVFTNYGGPDGLFPKPGKLLFLPDGRLVSGANRGFHHFYPDSILRRDFPPKVYLNNFKVFDEEIALPEIIDQIDTLHLTYKQNHFSLEFGALNFGFNERTQFAYRLEGYQSDWVYSGLRNYVSYTNLPPGHYKLRVKAANKHGLWSEKEKVICLVIYPPFWQAWWFILALVLVSAFLVYSLYRVWRNWRRAKEARSVIHYFGNANYANSSVHDIVWDLTYNCIARLGFEDCVVYLLDESGEMLIQEAAYGAKSPRVNVIKNPIQIPLGKGIVGAVALSGKAEIVSDTRKDPRYILDDAARLSEISVPITHGNMTIGVIDSEHSKLGFFTPFHLTVLKTIALLFGEKIASARNMQIVREKEQQLADLNRNLAETELSALRAQMNPHFLFNSLNSINWYILKNKPKEASLYLTKFSKLIRMILDHSKEQFISLEQELQALKFYIEMEAIRFEEEFEFSIVIDPELDLQEIKVPPLIFQPFVENAIWHGLVPKSGPGRLEIRLWEADDFFYCCIQDNGIGRAAAEAAKGASVKLRESKGVSITQARLASAGNENPVTITDLVDEDGRALGTKVEIRIQLQ